MSPLNKVKEIVNFIQAVNPHAIANPGLFKARICKDFHEINLSPPSEIIELYQWHNGIGELDCFLNFMNLDRAIDWYKGFLQSKTKYTEWKWNKNYFPLLNMNGDVQLCLDFETLAVITVDRECDTVEKIANHYTNYLDALLYVFNNEAFKCDDESGCIVFDQEVWKYARNFYQIRHPWL